MMKVLAVQVLFSLVWYVSCRDADGRQLVLAHRGASGYLPEQTDEAIVMAFMMGADFIEQDVVLTKDDVPIIMHDLYLDEMTDVAQVFPERNRTEDSHYYAIDFTLAEIKQLKVSERFYPNTSSAQYPDRFPQWKSHFSLSTLEERIELIQGFRFLISLIPIQNVFFFIQF